MNKKDIVSLSFDELKIEMESIGEKAFRTKQIYEWLQKPAEECETDEFIFIRDMMREVMDKSE